MVTELRRYVVKNLKHPIKEDVNRDIEWICNCLGFADSRDKEKTASKVFKLLVDAAKEGKGLTSEEIAESVKPTRGAVVHHLNKFIKAGLVIKINSKYELRMGSLKKTVEEVNLDIQRVLNNISEIAESVDNKIGLKSR